METDAGLDGFLSENHAYEAEISRSNHDAFDLARRINRECHSLIFNKVEVHNRDGQSMVVVALFLRALQALPSGHFAAQQMSSCVRQSSDPR